MREDILKMLDEIEARMPGINFIEESLPDRIPPNPTICIRREKLERFNFSYKVLLETLADIVGVDYHNLCLLDLLHYYADKEANPQGEPRMKIKQILEELVSHYASKDDDGEYWGHDTVYGKGENIAQAHADIIQAVLKCLPEKEKCRKGEQYWMWNSLHNVYEYGVMMGKNQAIADMKKRLEESRGKEQG